MSRGRRRVSLLAWSILLAAQSTGLGSSENSLERAFRAYSDKNYIQAMVESRRAVEEQPENPYCQHLYGLSLAALKQYTEAEESLQLAIAMKPDEAAFYYDLGYVRVERRDYAEAIAPLEKAVELDGENLMARFLLGRALVLGHRSALIGDFSERALVQFRAVAEADPRFPSVHYHLARIHVNEGRIEESLKEFQLELDFHPDNYLALVDYGELLLEQGETERALEHLARARGLAPEMPFLHYVLSKALQKLGRTEEALESARESVRLSPDNPEAHYQLGLLYRETGQLELAREELKLFQTLKKARGEQ